MSDGGAPISRCQVPDMFARGAEGVGFAVHYFGGAFRKSELETWQRIGRQASNDPRLAKTHRDFLAALVTDARGYPTYKEATVGINAVFELHKEAK